MFEHIYFNNNSNANRSDDLQTVSSYLEFKRSPDMPDIHSEHFQLDGQSKYIIGHPITPEYRKVLIHMQSFNYMESGPQYYTERNNYASLLILYTYEGHGQLCYGEKTYDLYEGDGFIIDCRKSHFYKTIGSRWVHADLHIYDGSAPLLYNELMAHEKPIFHTPNRELYQIQLEEVLRNNQSTDIKRDYLVSNSLEKLLMLVHDHLSMRVSQKMPENLRLLQLYMEKHFQEKLKIDDLAVFASMSKYHFIRQFSSYTGFTPHEYLVHLRLLYAENLLVSTDLPSYRIGVLSGFSTESNFIEKFKTHYGMSPGEYRRKRR